VCFFCGWIRPYRQGSGYNPFVRQSCQSASFHHSFSCRRLRLANGFYLPTQQVRQSNEQRSLIALAHRDRDLKKICLISSAPIFSRWRKVDSGALAPRSDLTPMGTRTRRGHIWYSLGNIRPTTYDVDLDLRIPALLEQKRRNHAVA